MSITTKGGDEGKTSLYTGERVWKDEIRVEAYATLDELNSCLGLAKHFVSPDSRNSLEEIQRKIFRACSELASTHFEGLDRINETDITFCEEIIYSIEKEIPLTGFVIPGKTIPSGHLDICRTTVRRAERRVISLNRDSEVSPLLRRFLNRLSDVFHMLARKEELLLTGSPQYLK